MTRSTLNPWLNRFAILTAATTLALIGAGGLVTSHGAGMAVPDWPTTYGYNMFLFPVSQWVGGIFYEHTHRLLASLVGFLTIILMVWLWCKEERRWLRHLGVAALAAVVAQGVLGGLRVTLFKAQLGIFHATLAQLFFVLLCLIAVFTSKAWVRGAFSDFTVPPGLRYLFVAGTVLVLIQLILGAAMRHQHAGLAVPDFPLAYGKVWPATDAASLEKINQSRVDVRDFGAVTAFHVRLHMAHRLGAATVLAWVAGCAWAVRRSAALPPLARRMAFGWLGVILLQALLGAGTVWSNKAADIATAHVVLGAVSLAVGALISCLLSRLTWDTRNDVGLQERGILTASASFARMGKNALA